MTRRDRVRIAKIAVFATVTAFGLLTGMSAGSKFQDSSDWPFSDLATAIVGVMIALSLVLAIVPLTRQVGRTIGLCAVTFTVALLLGHLMGARGPGGPIVPQGGGRGPR